MFVNQSTTISRTREPWETCCGRVCHCARFSCLARMETAFYCDPNRDRSAGAQVRVHTRLLSRKRRTFDMSYGIFLTDRSACVSWRISVLLGREARQGRRLFFSRHPRHVRAMVRGRRQGGHRRGARFSRLVRDPVCLKSSLFHMAEDLLD